MSSNNSKMSVTQLTLLTALNMMGSGIIMLPTKLAQVGTFSVVSWLVTATGSTAMAYAFAKCGMFSKNKGGMGGYAEYVFGKAGSFMANYTRCLRRRGTLPRRNLHRHDRHALDLHGPQLQGREHHGSHFELHLLGRDHPDRLYLHLRLVLVQRRHVCQCLEPAQHSGV